MIVNKNISYIELIDNAKAMKRYYIGLLSSFSIYDIRERNKAISDIKKELYQLNIKYYQVDKIWEYLNDDITYVELELLKYLK